MHLQGTITELRQAGAKAKLVKAVVKQQLEIGRLILDEETRGTLIETAKELASDASVIESQLLEWERMGIGRKGRFAINQK